MQENLANLETSIFAKLICSQIHGVVDISGTNGPTEVVLLPKFVEFCKEINGNVMLLLFEEKTKNVNKY